MNPRILYSQVIPGVSPGYCSVADISNYLRFVYEAAGMLERSPHWTNADKEALQAWSLQFFHFYETEADCAPQRDNPANHGTNYDFLTALLAMYAERNDLARAKILYYRDHRMSGQINWDGSNPWEMQRADNYMYHCYNFQVISYIADLAEHFDDINLWNYEMADGQGMSLALEFLIPYITGEKPWTFWPGEPFTMAPERPFRCLKSAALAYDSFRYERLTKKLGFTNMQRDYDNIAHARFAITTARGDVDHDGDVDGEDFRILARAWSCSPGSTRWNGAADISDPRDNIINVNDLQVLCEYWLDWME